MAAALRRPRVLSRECLDGRDREEAVLPRPFSADLPFYISVETGSLPCPPPPLLIVMPPYPLPLVLVVLPLPPLLPQWLCTPPVSSLDHPSALLTASLGGPPIALGISPRNNCLLTKP